MPRATIRQVAAAAGTSKSTAARALAGHPGVHEATRRKVLDAAQRLGYHPEPALRMLTAYRWNSLQGSRPAMTIAFLFQTVRRVVEGESRLVRIGYDFVPVLTAQSQTLGYGIDPVDVTEIGDTQRLKRILRARGIQALLVAPMVEGDPMKGFAWQHFAAVSCGVGELRPPIHSVDTDHFIGLRMAWRECLRRGYKRIGPALFRQQGADHNMAARYGAALYEQAQQPESCAQLPIFEGHLTDRDGFIAWFRDNRPDAVIALNELPYWWLRGAGYRIPEDVGFCALNQRRPSHISGVRINLERIANRALLWLDQLLRSFTTGLPTVPEEVYVPPMWSEAETLRRPRESATRQTPRPTPTPPAL
ncbi:MAG: LacI family transcriptional regulator [Verrucomicrobia bacterium]|nr:MAG: LacI family transcriptional regulator [Verrucomicrobiota bacterium]